MKRIFNISLSVFLLAVAFSSCKKTDGALYNGEDNKLSFFGTKIDVNMTNGVLEIPIARTSKSGTLSVPLKLTAKGAGYTNVFIPEPVVFADGEAKTTAKVKYGSTAALDPSSLSVVPNNMDVNVGLAFPFTLVIDSANASPSKKLSIDVNAASRLEFEDPVTTTMNSTEGWAESELEVKIQKAKGANVYKVVSPFGKYSIAFMIKADGKTVVFPKQAIDIHPSYGDISMSNVVGKIDGKKVILNVGGYTIPDGRGFGGGVEIITLP